MTGSCDFKRGLAAPAVGKGASSRGAAIPAPRRELLRSRRDGTLHGAVAIDASFFTGRSSDLGRAAAGRGSGGGGEQDWQRKKNRD